MLAHTRAARMRVRAHLLGSHSCETTTVSQEPVEAYSMSAYANAHHVLKQLPEAGLAVGVEQVSSQRFPKLPQHTTHRLHSDVLE
jgi:hypothetical protein